MYNFHHLSFGKGLLVIEPIISLHFSQVQVQEVRFRKYQSLIPDFT